MSEPARVLIVANRTAATPELLEAVRRRAQQGDATFRLLVPASAHGLHKVVDPEDAGGDEEAREVLRNAIPRLSEVTGGTVQGEIGDPEPLSAIQDSINLSGADEIIISTLPSRMSKWLRLDLVSKARGLGLPVTHVEAEASAAAPSGAPSA